MSLLEVKNLSVFFGKNKAVDDISFSLAENEVLGIVGESGSGKSVTSLSVLGLLPYPKAKHSAETKILFEGNEINLADEKQLMQIRGKDISFIFQEPMSSLNPLHTIGRQISEAILIHRKSANVKKEVIELLNSTGIDNAEERLKSYPHELSGGQRQRVMIAMALANNPKILIADEPTTALDVTIQAQILELLADLKKKYKMSLIFISHDLRIIQKIADRVCVMKDGKIVETGAVKEVFSSPKHSYTKRLIGSFLPLKINNNMSKEAVLTGSNINISFPIKKNFWGGVKKEIKAVNDVSFSLNKNETLGIVGESGSGKTTLGLAITGLIKYKGKISLDQTSKSFRKNLQIVFQDPYNSLNPRMTVEDIVAEGLEIHFPKLSKKERYEKIADVLNSVGMNSSDMQRYPHEFSGGQRQRIAIARALVLNPEILVLDEPTSALDVTIQKQIVELLNDIQKNRGISYIFISHDMNVIRAVSDKIAVMKDGKIVEEGTVSEVFGAPKNDYTKKLISANL